MNGRPFSSSIDVGMIQRGDRPRFAPEPREAFGVGGHICRQDLERDIAPQPRIVRAIHVSHAARADGGQDFVRTQARSDCQRHCGSRAGTDWEALSGREL
jgi:hypothetical protein